MFFFYMLLILVIILTILVINTTIQIHIENLKITIPKINKRNINKDYKILIKFYILNKINYLKLDITKTKMEKRIIRKNINKIKRKIEKDKNEIDTKVLKSLKNIKWNIKRLNLKINLGLEDASKSAIFVGVLSLIISVGLGILKNNKKLTKNNEIYWKIIPIYQGKMSIKISLNIIWKIKIKDIIKFLLGQEKQKYIAKIKFNDIISKKRKQEKKYG